MAIRPCGALRVFAVYVLRKLPKLVPKLVIVVGSRVRPVGHCQILVVPGPGPVTQSCLGILTPIIPKRTSNNRNSCCGRGEDSEGEIRCSTDAHLQYSTCTLPASLVKWARNLSISSTDGPSSAACQSRSSITEPPQMAALCPWMSVQCRHHTCAATLLITLSGRLSCRYVLLAMSKEHRMVNACQAGPCASTRQDRHAQGLLMHYTFRNSGGFIQCNHDRLPPIAHENTRWKHLEALCCHDSASCTPRTNSSSIGYVLTFAGRTTTGGLDTRKA